ncbi:MAG: EamA family transporter [Actinomycetes bacterium]
MIAVWGGLSAALLWGIGILCSARASRLLPTASVVAWVLVVGLVADSIAITLTRTPAPSGLATWLELAAAGVCSVTGLGLLVAGLRFGKVGIVAAITSTEGAFAALLAVAGGERLPAAAGVLLVVVVIGVLVATFSRDASEVIANRPLLAASLATAAAVASAGAIFLVGKLTHSAALLWVILPPRVVGTLGVLLPLLLTGKLRISRRALPLLMVAGVAEISGYLCYAVGARHSVAISAVLAAMFSVVTVVGAYLLHGERLTRHQLFGVGVIVAGVAGLTALVSTGG